MGWLISAGGWARGESNDSVTNEVSAITRKALWTKDGIQLTKESSPNTRAADTVDVQLRNCGTKFHFDPLQLVAVTAIINIVHIIGASARADVTERAADNRASETRAVSRVSTARAGKNQMRTETSKLQKISSLLHLWERNI